MSTPKFAEIHNLVAFLDKPEESEGFEQIIDFLNASSIRYALMVNPTIYTSCIKQFWATAKVQTVNEEVQIQALVDGKKVIVTETSVRRALHLKDAKGTYCLPTATIFAELERMGYENLSQKLTFYKAFFSPQWKFLIHTILQCLSAKTTAWNEFSSTMASAIICLATNQIFNFSKYIFNNMVKNLEGGVKFLMYPRFVQVFLDKQVKDMSKHKEIYVTPSHTKKIFANMKREGKGFSGRITPLFQTMMVQAPEEVGEGSAVPTDSHHTTTQPSTSRPQKKQSRRKQKKDSGPTEPITDEATNEEHMSTPSYDPSQSGEDRMQLNELMDLCAKLSDRVLAMENTNTSQAVEIATLKERVKKLEKKKSAKPKAVTTAATTVTPASSRPKAKGIVFHDQEEQAPASTPIVSPSQLPQAKDKGKAKMVEPEKPLKKKDQIAIDEEVARNLEAQLQAELEEEERLSRQKEEEANIALIESWDNTQAMMDADFQLAQQMQTEEQEQLSIKEKSKLFVELLEKRKKHFAALRAQEKRNKPPTKAQKRNTMSTYLKNMAGYKHNQLKSKSYDEIQEMFDKEMKRVNTFVDMDTELVKGSKTKAEGSFKRAKKELESDNSKKQRIDEHVEAKGDDDQEEAEIKNTYGDSSR
ncbi:hypothetical protein Tco_0264747 [Tanacetum coccineum]